MVCKVLLVECGRIQIWIMMDYGCVEISVHPSEFNLIVRDHWICKNKPMMVELGWSED
jgi:hypothetical protein